MKKLESNSTAEASAVAAAEAQTFNDTESVGIAPVSVRVVVLATEGTEDTARAVWEMALSGEPLCIMTVGRDAVLSDVLQDILADNEVADHFVLVPAGCISCASVTFEELHLPVVYVKASGERCPDLFPMAFDKEDLVQRFSADDFTPDNIVASTLGDRRAIEVTFKEGNFVTPVFRGNPCEHIVMEALVRKKYIVANPEGFAAITPLLKNTILRDE